MDNDILCRVIIEIWVSPKELKQAEMNKLQKTSTKDKLETVDEVIEDE